MSRSNSDFGGYRGRRTVTDILRFIAITLTVVVVLVVAGLFFLQKYIVYTPDGPKLQLPALFQREENPGGAVSVPDPGSLSIVEQPPVDPPPVPGEEDGASAGYALQISVDQVINGETPEPDPAMKGLIVEMKDPMGRLSWHSEQAVAGWSEVNGQQAVGDALKKDIPSPGSTASWTTRCPITTTISPCAGRARTGTGGTGTACGGPAPARRRSGPTTPPCAASWPPWVLTKSCLRSSTSPSGGT